MAKKDTNKFLKLFGKVIFSAFDYREELAPIDHITDLKKLKAFNKEGRDIYFAPNEMRGDKRLKSETKSIRAIWIDDDKVRKKPRTKFPLEPSIVVETSRGKYHYYWLTSTTDIDGFERVMETMTNEYGNDKKVKHLNALLRVPGFNHCKDLDNKFKVRMVGGTLKSYEWKRIKHKFPPVSKEEMNEIREKTKFNKDRAIKEILNKENFHDNLRDMAWEYVRHNKIQEVDEIIAMLEMYMEKVPKKQRDNRWFARINRTKLDTYARSAIEKCDISGGADYEIPDIKQKSESREYAQFPELIGRMKQIENVFMKNSPYPHRTISSIGAISVMAAIAGRRFNINGLGLNHYSTALMKTGGGKESLKDTINKILRGSGKMNATSYLGDGGFTGPKAVVHCLENGRSFLSIFTEAGFLFKSKGGDQQGLTRMILDLFTCSGANSYSSSKSYSSKEDYVKSFRAPCFSCVNESTPRIFIEAFDGAEDTGQFTRMWLFRIFNPTTKINRKKEFQIPPDLKTYFENLIDFCNVTQRKDNPEAISFKTEPYMYDFADKQKELEAKYYESGDVLRGAMYSRIAEKVFKLSALMQIADLNITKIKDVKELKLKKKYWNLAVQISDFEIKGLEEFYNKEASEYHEFVMTKAFNIISKFLEKNGKPYGSRQRLSRQNLRLKRIPRSLFKQKIDQAAKPFNFKPRGDLFQDILSYMKDENYIEITTEVGRQYVKVNEDFFKAVELFHK